MYLRTGLPIFSTSFGYLIYTWFIHCHVIIPLLYLYRVKLHGFYFNLKIHHGSLHVTDLE